MTKKPRVLYVDDVIIPDLEEEVLQRKNPGIDLKLVCGNDLALQEVSSAHYDAIVYDVGMEVRNFYHALKFKEIQPDVVLVGISLCGESIRAKEIPEIFAHCGRTEAITFRDRELEGLLKRLGVKVE